VAGDSASEATWFHQKKVSLMTVDDVIQIGQQAMLVTLLVSAPMLLSGMVVGLLISVLQSVTQIQEITLSFVPKILVVLVSFVVFLPWMSDMILTYVTDLFNSVHTIVIK
jgi:flagellar biosynthesis protein FliQ